MRNLIRRLTPADKWLGVFLLAAILVTYGVTMFATSHLTASQPQHATPTPTYDATCAQDGYDAPECADNPAGAQTVIYWAHCTEAHTYRLTVTDTPLGASQAQTENYWPIPEGYFTFLYSNPDLTCNPGPSDGTGW